MPFRAASSAFAGLLFLFWPAVLTADADPARQALLEKKTLARVGDQRVTTDDFRAELARRTARSGWEPESFDALQQQLTDMVRRQALLTRARQAGYAERQDLVELFEQMLIKAYLRDTLETRLAGLVVADAEVAAHYAEHAESYEAPARSQAAIVFYEVPSQATVEHRAAVEKQARLALAEAAALDPAIRHFGEIARRDSNHRASRFQGGVFGWLPHGPAGAPSSWPPQVAETVLGLSSPGDLGPLVVAPEGFYLVRLVAREASRRQPLEQVAAGIRHFLLREKRAAAEQAFEAEMNAELGVELDFELLRSLEIPTENKTPPPMPTLAAAPALPLSGGSR